MAVSTPIEQAYSSGAQRTTRPFMTHAISHCLAKPIPHATSAGTDRPSRVCGGHTPAMDPTLPCLIARARHGGRPTRRRAHLARSTIGMCTYQKISPTLQVSSSARALTTGRIDLAQSVVTAHRRFGTNVEKSTSVRKGFLVYHGNVLFSFSEAVLDEAPD